MHPDAERLSSYLDDELDSVERAAVEQLLSEDPAARELLAELRQLRTGLQSMPQHRLPEGFADEVMRAAERLMLLDPADSIPTAAVRDAAEWTAPVSRAAAWNLWRSPAWFVSGAAAAVLLMLTLARWRGGDGPEVARIPGRVKVAAGSDAAVIASASGGAPADSDPAASDATDPAPPAANAAESPDSSGSAGAPSRSDAPKSPNSELLLSADGTEVKRHPPLGTMFWADVTPEAVAAGHFGTLLREHHIRLLNEAAASDSSAPVSVYVEATPVELTGVFDAVSSTPKFYPAIVIQTSLGVFKEPHVWTEILDSAEKNAGANSDSTIPSRAAYINPDMVPAKPLAVEEANAEMLRALELNIPAGEALTDDGQQNPTVDKGLVRAVFVFRLLKQPDVPAATP